MAKYCGMIGYLISEENPDNPGVFIPRPTERKYYGDILDDTRKWDSVDKINDDLNITNRLSVLIDSFATSHLGAIRYATFMGVRWNVKSVFVSHPRLILSLGGVYNGPVPEEEIASEAN